MRVILQRVKHSNLFINSIKVTSINAGILLLLGIEENDTDDDIHWLCTKICGMRIFSDTEGKMNLDIKQVNGEVLIVSQFTLYASVKKGNRPSFTRAAKPEIAIPYYERFIQKMEAMLEKPCKTGKFGADMQIESINDGPVTIILDSKTKE
jgi:D-tyrosyl-tRNA(Tyr) deacylase